MKKKSILLFTTILVVALVFTAGCGKKETKKEKKSKYDYLVLVNKKTKLPDDWEQYIEEIEELLNMISNKKEKEGGLAN